MKDRPIGIFDSGIGGLTVIKEIVRVLPDEDTIYLGDTARVPYGAKSRETVIRYSLQIADFLLKYDIKLLVIACNTASAYALSELEKKLNIPVIGVIEPGAKMAALATLTKKIGVIGTEGTIKSSAYVAAIKSFAPDAAVFTKACPLFVPLAEEGWEDSEVLRLTAEIYLKDMKEKQIDTLLLGCTHYPLLKAAIQTVMGEKVKLIDSGEATAHKIFRLLDSHKLKREKPHQAIRRFFVTDSPERFAAVGKKFFNDYPLKVELVKIDG